MYTYIYNMYNMYNMYNIYTTHTITYNNSNTAAQLIIVINCAINKIECYHVMLL